MPHAKREARLPPPRQTRRRSTPLAALFAGDGEGQKGEGLLLIKANSPLPKNAPPDACKRLTEATLQRGDLRGNISIISSARPRTDPARKEERYE